jgi:sterol desaturase/sphingolipid hydroxylase (fatty acid hydroxylase superfamily)
VKYTPPVWLGTFVVIVMLLVYVGAVAATMLIPGYEIPGSLTTLIFVVVSAVLSVKLGLLGGDK